ncbi:hypothetical protein Tco_1217336 [Tanacetum coccineum]
MSHLPRSPTTAAEPRDAARGPEPRRARPEKPRRSRRHRNRPPKEMCQWPMAEKPERPRARRPAAGPGGENKRESGRRPAGCGSKSLQSAQKERSWSRRGAGHEDLGPGSGRAGGSALPASRRL